MKTLTKIASTLLKLGGVFVAFGYFSLRAHLTVLGVPWDSPLGVERYLAEAYQLILAIITPVLSYLPRVTLWAAIIVVLIGMMSRWKRLKAPLAQVNSSLEKLRNSWILPVVLTLVAAAFYPLLLRDVDFARTAPLVGPLNGFSYYYMPGFFTALVLLCFATWALYDSFAPETFQGLERSIRVCWRVAAASVAVLLFFAPVVYGTLWHPMRYPTVKVSMKTSQTIQCGVLILRGDSDLLLWRAKARKGELMTIPNGEIHAFTAGEEKDIRKWVEQAIHTGSSSPDCGEISDPPTEAH